MAVASYDSLADWYGQWASWPTILLGDARQLLPSDLDRQRILDVGCGHGRLSRELASAEESGASGRLEYRQADIADLGAWWDGTAFDGAACEMALMDVADLDGVVHAVASVLRPGGWFAASLVHPCFPGGEIGLSSWPPHAGYSTEGFWQSADHNPDGIRIRIGSHHRTLATYLNTFMRHGLQLTAVAEPADALPQYLAVACRRAVGQPD